MYGLYTSFIPVNNGLIKYKLNNSSWINWKENTCKLIKSIACNWIGALNNNCDGFAFFFNRKYWNIFHLLSPLFNMEMYFCSLLLATVCFYFNISEYTKYIWYHSFMKLYQRLLQSFINRFFEMCNLCLHPFEARVKIVSWWLQVLYWKIVVIFKMNGKW